MDRCAGESLHSSGNADAKHDQNLLRTRQNPALIPGLRNGTAGKMDTWLKC